MSAVQIVLIVFGTLGFLAIGSFTCVIIDRMPLALDEPNEYDELWDTNSWSHVLGGTSRCSSCGIDVRPVDNIPVISFLLLRGKCRGCSERIPAFHPFVEIASPIMFLLAIWALGFEWVVVPVLWFIPVALAVSAIDLRTFMVPTRVVWPAFGVAVALCVAVAGIEGEWTRLIGSAVGLAVLAGPLFLIWFALPKSMGFGDIRLATLIGFLVGFFAVDSQGKVSYGGAIFLAVLTLALASALGVVLGLVVLRARGRKAKVPFGPTMLLAGYFCMLMAVPILEPLVT